MSWYVLDLPTSFIYTELPEVVEFENDRNERIVRYVPERTCHIVEAYCSECGKPDPSCGDAKYCAYCGAKVVE